MRDLIPPPPPPGPEEPGQFAFADPARVEHILRGAGFAEAALAPEDVPMRLGADAAEAAGFAMTLGQVSRALHDAPERVREAVRNRLLDVYRAEEGPEGVVMPAAIWLVTARA